MSKTTVVNVRDSDFDVYIGRRNRIVNLPTSKWANPFKIGRGSSRDDVIRQYALYIVAHPELLAALPELKGRVLGCWCKPQKCHGDLLAELADACTLPAPLTGGSDGDVVVAAPPATPSLSDAARPPHSHQEGLSGE